MAAKKSRPRSNIAFFWDRDHGMGKQQNGIPGALFCRILAYNYINLLAYFCTTWLLNVLTSAPTELIRLAGNLFLLAPATRSVIN